MAEAEGRALEINVEKYTKRIGGKTNLRKGPTGGFLQVPSDHSILTMSKEWCPKPSVVKFPEKFVRLGWVFVTQEHGLVPCSPTMVQGGLPNEVLQFGLGPLLLAKHPCVPLQPT